MANFMPCNGTTTCPIINIDLIEKVVVKDGQAKIFFSSGDSFQLGTNDTQDLIARINRNLTEAAAA